jgi:hypothetical protein
VVSRIGEREERLDQGRQRRQNLAEKRLGERGQQLEYGWNRARAVLNVGLLWPGEDGGEGPDDGVGVEKEERMRRQKRRELLDERLERQREVEE